MGRQRATDADLSGLMNNQQSGFTVIELIIVVAIIGILASLAVSAFQTYLVRAQVAEGVSMAASAKVPVVDAFNNSGRPPADRAATGMTPLATDTQGSYVSQVAIINGRIEITFGNDAHQDISGETMSVTPYISAGASGTDSFVWRCGAAPVPPGSSEMSGGGVESVHVPPSFDTRYMPKTCRG